MSKQHKVELARTLCASDSPMNKSQVARVLGIARSSLYVQTKRPKLDKALAVRIEEAQEKDDTMGHRKVAALLGTGKNRVKRVMRKYGLAARRKKQKYDYPGKASEIAPNKLREEGMDLSAHEVVFSDILEIKLSDGTRVRGCFALRHRTREVLGIAFDYHMCILQGKSIPVFTRKVCQEINKQKSFSTEKCATCYSKSVPPPVVVTSSSSPSPRFS
jgi:putative transposase